MSDSDSDSQFGTKRDLIESKILLDNAIQEYAESQRLGETQATIAREQLHTSVVGFFWRLRPHIIRRDGWDSVADIEDYPDDEIWSGIHPQTGKNVTLEGLKDVQEWIDKTETVTQDANHPQRATASETVEVPIRLPASASIEVAKVLTLRFDDMGWGVEPERTPSDEPEPEHLRGLLTRRDQDDAVDQLPARFKNGGDNE